jgi:hypothetical protein
MELPTSLGERAIWVIVILLGLGYVVGLWLNRRRSRYLGQWLSGSLSRLSGKPTWKWVGSMSSGGQATITDAGKPFQKVQFTYLLLTRELWPLWAAEWLRGKRDLLIIQAELRFSPPHELELVPIQGKLRDKLDQFPPAEPWQWHKAAHGMGIATHSEGSDWMVRRAERFLEEFGPAVQRLSLRRRQPNLILFILLDGVDKQPSAKLLHAVREFIGSEAPAS